MSELNQKILAYIDLILPPAKKELEFVQMHDWSAEENKGKRQKIYDLQNKFNDRNIQALVNLYNLAEDELDHPKIKSAISTLIQFYEIFNARYNVLDQSFDWSSIDLDEKGIERKIEQELEFQSDVRKTLINLQNKLQEINFGSSSKGVNIALHGDIPLPLMMQTMFEDKFPEIKKYLENKD